MNFKSTSKVRSLLFNSTFTPRSRLLRRYYQEGLTAPPTSTTPLVDAAKAASLLRTIRKLFAEFGAAASVIVGLITLYRALKSEIKEDIKDLKTDNKELKTDIKDLKTDNKELKTDFEKTNKELKTEFEKTNKELKTDNKELKTDFEKTNKELKADFRRDLDKSFEPLFPYILKVENRYQSYGERIKELEVKKSQS